MRFVDVKAYAQEILDKAKAAQIKKKLYIFTAGNDPASASYIKGKIKDCEYCGIPYEHIRVNSQDELATLIKRKCMAANTGGIIIQLPLPDGWDEKYFTNLVPPYLDVDGFVDDSHFEPCTPEGIMYILKQEIGDLTGKRALVIGRGWLVGIPMIARLIAADCTVTVAHSKTTNLNELLCTSDIIISAAGKPRLVDLRQCSAKIVIDVGVNRDENGKLCGDCYNFDESYTWFGNHVRVTPVPGGIGLMTRAMLMSHMVDNDRAEPVMCGEE